MERCLACEAVVSRGLRDCLRSTSIKNPKNLPDEWSFTSAALLAIGLASEATLQEWRPRAEPGSNLAF
jgi:hypothetical protein